MNFISNALQVQNIEVQEPIKIIIVDDSATIRGLMQHLLSSNTNIKIIGMAAHGQELLTLLKTECPDVILLDMIMPVMDGLETLQAIFKSYSSAQVIWYQPKLNICLL